LLNQGVLAQVPSRGSVGASGDLAPSAHAALLLIGEGTCTMPMDGEIKLLPACEALLECGQPPVTLAPKEALSLINGTHLTTALACQV
jgi:histidine ammonia-lyase